jgi:ferric-dicitrate binding protein FerR (iron transport regulator)/tetratricopeptide (TPR) repeat protein
MNEPDSRSEQDRQEDIAERNVERLVSTAYRPEVPSQEFVERVATAMLAEARERAASAPVRRQSVLRRSLPWAVAATLLLSLGAVLWHLRNTGSRKQLPHDEVAVQREQPGSPAASPVAVRSPQTVRDWPIDQALTARPRAAAPPAQRLAAGESLHTGPTERRRVELPDGSILYLNRDTAITLQAPRRVVLDRGEVYLEVAPRHEDSGANVAELGDGNRFVVLTPDRELTALGTKFNVRTEQQTTSVVVVQGQVQVSGLPSPLNAGQQFAPAANQQAAARAVDQFAHVIDWARDLIVSAESPLVPASAYTGGALVAKRPDGSETNLSMRRYHLDVHIEDGFARTTIDQTYFNRETWRMEGTFYFPLPPDASLSRLAMYVDGKLMEGGMAERQHAREVFETIVRKQKDPALLEWIDGSTFRMRVFPLEGRQEKRIVLSYSQRLPRLGQRVQYRFPGGHNMSQVDRWSCHVRARGAAACRWEADAHAFRAAKDGEDLTLDATAEKITPDRNVVIDLYDPGADASASPAPAVPDAQFATADHEGRRYLALRYRFHRDAEKPSRRRDWVFLFETSADRNPVLARAQVEVVRTLLENAERDDTFAILTASSRVHRYADGPLAATPQNVQQAVRFLEQAHLVGALDLAGALRAAAAELEKAKNPWLVHVGAGYPKLGDKQPAALARLIPASTCYVGIGVGNRWNRAFMKQAAGQSGGYFVQINPDEPIKWRTIELLSRLNSPRLVNARVVDERERLRFLTPSDVVCGGEELFAVARVEGDGPLPDFVEITGQVDGQPFAKRLPVGEASRGAGYLPRTWAKLEIDRLVAEDAVAHRDEIVKLSMAMYVMSPFTSLLVLENEQMYKDFKVDRGRKDHWALYPCPEKIEVVHEPLAGPPAPPQRQEADPNPARPSVVQVLQTILVRVPPELRQRSSGSNQSSVRSVSVWQLCQPRYVWTSNWATFAHQWEMTPSFWGFAPDSGSGMESWGEWGGFASAGGRYDNGRVNINALYDWRLWNSGINVDSDGDGIPDSGRRYVPLFNRLEAWDRRLSVDLGIGRETQSLMMMVTPRIIIQEEEELPFDYNGDGDSTWQSAKWFYYDPLNIANPTNVDFDSRIDLITNFIEPRAWTDEVLGKRFLTRVYPVGDLVFPIQPLAFSHDGDFLAFGNGGGTIRLGDLDVSVLPSFHRPQLLSTWDDWSVPRGHFALTDVGSRGAAERRTLAALSNPTSLDLAETPLEMAIANLKDRCGVPFEIDKTALTNAGIRLDTPVTLHVKQVPLGEALRRLLRPLKLTFVLRGQAVLIIPDDYADLLDATVQDILTFAPGMHTITADVRAVLDAEAQLTDKPARGSIDRRADELIDRARPAGWYRLVAPGRNHAQTRVPFDGRAAAGSGDPRRTGVDPGRNRSQTRVAFDGRGRYRIETQTRLGLKEQIVSDGTQLWHLYPELGIGAQRQVSRFHRATLARWIPWLLPPVEDLAHGADVRAIDDRTVAIVPHVSKRAKPAVGTDAERAELRLVFAPEGRLAERQIVKVGWVSDPTGSGQSPNLRESTLWRETYAADGTVQGWDENGEEAFSRRVAVEPCEPPGLVPDKTLVILPLPWRTREHVLAARKLKDDGVHDGWSREDALAVLAAETATGKPSLLSTVGWCFLAKNDERLGFGPLLLAAGVYRTAAPTGEPADEEFRGLFRRLHEQPDAPLARYVAAAGKLRTEKGAKIGALGGPDRGFLQQFGALHDLCLAWQQSEAGAKGAEQRTKLERQTVRFLRRGRSVPFATAAISAVRRYGDDASFVRVFDEATDTFREATPLAFALRFEHAAAVAKAGDVVRGRDLLRSLANDMLDADCAPPLAEEVKSTFFSGNGGPDAWRQFVEHLTGQILRRRVDPSALAIARQLHKLGEAEAAERVFAAATGSASPQAQIPLALAAVSYLRSTGQDARAAARLEPLLADERGRRVPGLWRLAAAMAKQRGLPARSAEYLDQALDLEYTQASEKLELQRLRTDYRELLERYRDAGDGLAGAGADAQQRVVARVVRAADRWRSVDADTGDACRLAADALSRLGAVDLAWDYATSPLAGGAEASINWDERGREYHRQGQYELAQRAYALLFEADPANAQVLWNRAQALLEAGGRDRAHALLEELTRGSWDPKYDWIRRQAEQTLKRK